MINPKWSILGLVVPIVRVLVITLQVEVIPVDGAPGLTSCKQEEWAQNNIILSENLVNFRGLIAKIFLRS
jgi:hypothetical protein